MSEIVRIDGLGYAYPPIDLDGRREWVLRDINLEIHAGEFVSIMGAISRVPGMPWLRPGTYWMNRK